MEQVQVLIPRYGPERVCRFNGRLATSDTEAELGTLAHLPADPARYGFDTAALTRTPPTSARRAAPEHASPRGPGWTRHGWTIPPDDTHSETEQRPEGEEDL